jgi:hypothetical protein
MIGVHYLEEAAIERKKNDIFVPIEFVSLDYSNSNSFRACEVC